jgi:hypothetical protein
MSYTLPCKYCKKRITARDAGNMRNVMTTHVLTKCKDVPDDERKMWRMTALRD